MALNKTKLVALYFGVGLLVPLLFLLNAFVVPEPYSHPLIYVAMAPTHLMPFLEDRELLQTLTLWVFGRGTPNYAPISIVILIIFWFVLTVVMFYFARLYFHAKRNT